MRSTYRALIVSGSLICVFNTFKGFDSSRYTVNTRVDLVVSKAPRVAGSQV